jgi:hypothetical protein
VQRYVPPHHVEAMEATEGQHQKDARKSEVGQYVLEELDFTSSLTRIARSFRWSWEGAGSRGRQQVIVRGASAQRVLVAVALENGSRWRMVARV